MPPLLFRAGVHRIPATYSQIPACRSTSRDSPRFRPHRRIPGLRDELLPLRAGDPLHQAAGVLVGVRAGDGVKVRGGGVAFVFEGVNTTGNAAIRPKTTALPTSVSILGQGPLEPRTRKIAMTASAGKISNSINLAPLYHKYNTSPENPQDLRFHAVLFRPICAIISSYIIEGGPRHGK